MKLNSITITTGNFSVELNGSIQDGEVQKYVELGVKSEVYRKVFPKTEMQMAIATGATEFKDGKHSINKDFKRAKVAWDADLATKLQEIVQKEMGNGFVAEVKQYVASDNSKSVAEKAFAASVAALDAVKDVLPEGVYDLQVAALKTKYGME